MRVTAALTLARLCRSLDRVPSTAKRERVRVRVCDSVSVFYAMYPTMPQSVRRSVSILSTERPTVPVFSETEPQALTLTLSRFAVEGTRLCASCSTVSVGP